MSDTLDAMADRAARNELGAVETLAGMWAKETNGGEPGEYGQRVAFFLRGWLGVESPAIVAYRAGMAARHNATVRGGE